MNLCHGDVRLANIMFGKNKSSLIDFDYCGVEGVRLYPNGYNTDLLDTRRHEEAVGGNTLSKEHDCENSMEQWIKRNSTFELNSSPKQKLTNKRPQTRSISNPGANSNAKKQKITHNS